MGKDKLRYEPPKMVQLSVGGSGAGPMCEPGSGGVSNQSCPSGSSANQCNPGDSGSPLQNCNSGGGHGCCNTGLADSTYCDNGSGGTGCSSGQGDSDCSGGGSPNSGCVSGDGPLGTLGLCGFGHNPTTGGGL